MSPCGQFGEEQKRGWGVAWCEGPGFSARNQPSPKEQPKEMAPPSLPSKLRKVTYLLRLRAGSCWLQETERGGQWGRGWDRRHAGKGYRAPQPLEQGQVMGWG